MTKASSAAVVGSAGFIGRALMTQLRQDNVLAIPFTRSSPAVEIDGRPSPLLANVSTIYWLATSINPLLAETEPSRIVDDQEAFARFLVAARSIPNDPRIILLSSGGTVYDPSSPPPYGEDSPTNPMSSYGRAKLVLEQMLREARDLSGTVVRVANAFGPGQPAANGQGVIAHWLRAARRGEELVLFGNPDTARDYIFVADVVRALSAAHSAPLALPIVINIGSGEPTTVMHLARLLCDVVDYEAERIRFAPGRSFDVSRTWLRVELATKVLDWFPAVGLREGLEQSWDAVRRLGDPQP